MSLLKRLTLSRKKLEANQANARLPQRPATVEVIERTHDAHLLHGFYSKAAGSPAGGEAIRALGEKPDDFERLLPSLTETWQPEDDYERVLVRQLARRACEIAPGRRSTGREEDTLRKKCPSRGTNPPSPLESAKRIKPIRPGSDAI